MSEELMELEEQLEEADATERYLSFLSDELIIGVSTKYVIEIITSFAVTPLPMVPDYVKGIMNLRGQIIPIIDIRLRMGHPSIEYTSTTCTIVLNINSVYVGVVVDSVLQVLDIDQTQIAPIPTSSSQDLLDGMMSLDEKTVILFLDCERLVTNS